MNSDDIRIAKLVMRWAANGHEAYAPAVAHLASIVAEVREREATRLGHVDDGAVRVILAAVSEVTGLGEDVDGDK